MEMVVNTVRMVDYDQAKEYSEGDNTTLSEKLAIGLINPEDFKNFLEEVSKDKRVGIEILEKLRFGSSESAKNYIV